MGNVHSLTAAINHLGIDCDLSDQKNKILNSTHIFLPGVGSYKKAMEIIRKKNLDKIIKKAVINLNVKIFGICLGMQLLGSFSEEDGGSSGLHLIENKVTKLKSDNKNVKVPHVGFNKIILNDNSDNSIFKNLKDHSYFYFVHSYKMELKPSFEYCTFTEYGGRFISAFEKKNIVGTQFHPELSQSNGMNLLYNFLK